MEKQNSRASQTVVIAVGGSLVVPHISDEGGIDTPFLKALRKMLLAEINPPAGGSKRFVIVIGGGKTCRVYQSAAQKTGNVLAADLDRIGVASTRLNATLVLAAFGEKAYTHIIHDAMSEQELIRAQKNKANLFVACGGVPGRSTDYGAVKLAQVFGAKEVIIAGDTPYVYEKDPRKFPKAKPISELTWVAYEKLVPKKWTPGLSSPVDPVATQLAKKLKITAKILNGKDIPNFKNAIQNKPFHGTIIS